MKKWSPAQSWDQLISISDKQFLCKAARVSRNCAVIKWKQLPDRDKREIFEAAYRAAQWAAQLGLLLPEMIPEQLVNEENKLRAVA